MFTENSHFLAGKRIIVAGAGIAGLAFVIALRKTWPRSDPPPEILIYDRDDKEVNANREGYSLSLNGLDKDGGLVALQDLGLLDTILDHAVVGHGGGRFKIWASDWSETHPGLPSAVIRIARRDLRNILIEAAEATGTIHWGTSCAAAEKLENGRVRVRLHGGEVESTEDCDLLVAADGAHSKVRASLRPDDKLHYAGAVQIGGNAVFPHGIPEPVKQDWGLMLSGQAACCFFSPVDKETVVWAVSRLEPQLRVVEKDRTPEQFQALMKEALELGHMFQEPFQTMVEATNRSTAFVIPARDKEPFAHDKSLSGVVFIGDSNHAVSPFAGNGANTALKDGWDLASAICGETNFEAALADYDQISVPRAQKTLKVSHGRIARSHCTGIRYFISRIGLWIGSTVMWLKGEQ